MELSTIYGKIPRNLNGYFMKNGPKPIENIKYNHPFDGHGCINKFHFKDGQVFYSSIRIETNQYKEEKKANMQIYRTLGTNKFNNTIFDLNINNFSNIALLNYNDKLYSLFEGGLPWEIDYINNKTIKQESFNNNLLQYFSNNIYIPVSVHPKIYDDNIYNISSFIYGLMIFSNEKIEKFIKFPINENYYVHDFQINNRFYIIYLNRVEIDSFNSLCTSNKTILEAMKFKKNNKLLLIDRKSLKEYWLKVPLVYDKTVMHIAYTDQKDDKLIIDMSLIMNEFDMGQIEDPYNFDNLNLTRFIVDLNRMELKCVKTNIFGDMPIAYNSKYQLLINKNEIIMYNTKNLLYKRLYVDCLKLEEPAVYNEYIILIAHYSGYTGIYILDKNLEIASMSILQKEIHHGFHGIFIH